MPLDSMLFECTMSWALKAMIELVVLLLMMRINATEASIYKEGFKSIMSGFAGKGLSKQGT